MFTNLLSYEIDGQEYWRLQVGKDNDDSLMFELGPLNEQQAKVVQDKMNDWITEHTLHALNLENTER